MLKKTVLIILSLALSLGSSIALAAQHTAVKAKKNIQTQTPAVQNIDKDEVILKDSEGNIIKNEQAIKAGQKIKLTNDRAIILRKGPGHVA